MPPGLTIAASAFIVTLVVTGLTTIRVRRPHRLLVAAAHAEKRGELARAEDLLLAAHALRPHDPDILRRHADLAHQLCNDAIALRSLIRAGRLTETGVPEYLASEILTEWNADAEADHAMATSRRKGRAQLQHYLSNPAPEESTDDV